MRKHILTLIAILLTINCIAQEWHNTGSEKATAPKTELISSSEKQTIIQFKLDGYHTTNVATPQGVQNIVSVPEMVSRLEAGCPDLPHYPIPVIIGDKAEMKVSVSNCEYTDFENIEIAPSKGNLSRQVNPEDVPYTYGEVYQQNTFYPEKSAILDAPYISRDFRGQNILVTPFAYNPITKTLRVFTKMTIVMEKVSDNGENQKIERKSNSIKSDAEIQHYYQRRFINFGKTGEKYTFIEDRGTMLVICPEQYQEAMQPFVDWKNISGRPTEMVSVTETGGNNAENIKSYIRNKYQNDNLEFVLLVGDYNDITPSPISTGYTDSWFGQLEGNDHYIEVFVGRFSVESVADVENHVNKVIYYERDMPAGLDWLDKGVGIGSTDGQGMGHHGELDWQHIDFIRDTLMHYTYTEISQRYDRYNNPTAAQLDQDFNAGAGICNYCNHGSETSWFVCSYNNNHVNNLTNDYKWPFIISVACLNGKFNYYQPCFAETWMRAKNNTTGAPTGAIGGIFSCINQSWAPPQYGQDEMNAILTEWRDADLYNHTMGGTMLNGNEYILDAAPSDYGITHDTWLLFGDPSLLLRTTNPTEMNVTCTPDVLMIGLDKLNITADIDFGIATLSIDGEVLASSYIQNGASELNFSSLQEVGSATLTIVGYNKVTYMQDMEIVPLEGPFVMLDTYSVNDENGQIDYNETTGLSITIKNAGVENASDITVTLSSNSEFVEVIDSVAHVSSLAVGEHFAINNLFTLQTANNIIDGTPATFTLVCSCPQGSWTSSFNAVLHAPSLALADAATTGSNTPGQNGTLIIKIKNEGSSASPNGVLIPFSSTNDIVFNHTSYSFSSIPANDIASIEMPFSISGNATNGTAYEIDFVASTGLYSLNGNTLIIVGADKEDFETGDFEKYNWMFSSNAWTIVSDEVHSGNYAARSGATTNNHTSDMILTLQVANEGEISFWKKTSSETNCDKLLFYIDNTEMGAWSGYQDQEWKKAIFPISTGTHLLRWVYSKDASSAQGEDCAWVDDIQFPPTSVVYNMPPVENLMAAVNCNTVSLSWDALSSNYIYIIERNGYEVTRQSSTQFTETLADGIYTYSVIATDNQGHYSVPSYAVVEVGVLCVDDMEIKFTIYPNPTHGVLNVKTNCASFNYAIFNRLGQLIDSGSAIGGQQIEIRDLTKGLYFIRFVSGKQTVVKKILVE